MEALLSPGQRALLERTEAHPEAGWKNAIGQKFITAWKNAAAVLHRVVGGE